MTKPKRYRSPNKIKPTEVTATFWRYFLKPFAEAYNYAQGQEERVEGYAAFFGASHVRVAYGRARQPFKMPGTQWAETSGPKRFIDGTGRRHVKVGDVFVLRFDAKYPDRCEIEFDEQVFVLNEAQYDAIAEYIKLEA
jgi:hypothetical protein